MPEIQPLRGIRYDLGHVGSLGDVVAPPYDVISPELQETLYKQHPCNAVRLILNRIEPTDDETNNRYTRAKRFLKNWQSEGVLFTEADPAIYVYHQQFELLGRTITRRGFMARTKLSHFGEGVVFPHEETMSAPKQDRQMLMVVCEANLSPVFGLYPDKQCEAQNVLEAAIAGQAPIEATDHLGVIHRLWPVTEVSTVAQVVSLMESKPMFIADGHHRYETACEYRDQIYDSGFLSADHPANYVLMTCIAMEDEGLQVLPTHRMFKGLPDWTAEELATQLGDYFQTRTLGQDPEAAHQVWEEIETGDDAAALGLYTRKDRRWTLAQITDKGREKLAEVASDHNEDWCQLGVSVLHRLVVQHLFGMDDLPKPKYVHLVDEVIEGLATDEYPLAALLLPATVEEIQKVSLQGERMPAKSTYFYPKLLSGLVINPLNS